MTKKHVVVAMSGGVDSSVTAYLLREAGYNVSGAHLILSSSGKTSESNISELEKTCGMLGIPLQTLDFRAQFQEKVIASFCREYALGRTPNPCVVCNEQVKFGLLLRWAREWGADFLATGHYARLESGDNGYRLLRAMHREKDQSYFLYRLGQDVLKNILLPLGNWSKPDVRKLAASLGLPVGDRRESEDLCFIHDDGYRSFIARHISSRPGDIVDTGGAVLGRHEGLEKYTVGQRQGLGLSSNRRLYVLELDAAQNRLVVGAKEALMSLEALVCGLCWVSGNPPEDLEKITAKIRYRSPETAVRLQITGDTALVMFDKPQMAVTPGQSVVFYRGDVVLGGGIIAGKRER
ncbi:MAG: tRNA 2-thiouridine(34) synthase MnmA [Chloroflexota bacterium]